MSGEREREHCKSMILISAIISMVIPTMADTIVPESISFAVENGYRSFNGFR